MKAPFLFCALLALAGPALSDALIEAELALARGAVRGGDGRSDRKLTAFGGACLGNDWGGRRGDWAEYPVRSEGGAQVLYLRYARERRQAASSKTTLAAANPRLSVRVGQAQSTVALPETGSWEVWRWIRVSLGPVDAGMHTLRLEAFDEGFPLNLDALILAGEGQSPPEVSRALLFDGSRHVRIQLSPSVKPLAMDKLFAIAEATYGFLKEYLGEEPKQRLTVHVIASQEQGQDHVGHSQGYALYLEEAHIWDTSHNWVHEMTHCFQRESGSWPTWLSEGEAWLTYYEAETALFGRAADTVKLTPAFYRSRLPQWQAVIFSEDRNLLQQWNQGLPREKIGAAYGFANYILGELRERSSPHLMRDYRALLRQEASSEKKPAPDLTPEQRDAAVIDRLSRAAGSDLRPLFREWKFRFAP